MDYGVEVAGMTDIKKLVTIPKKRTRIKFLVLCVWFWIKYFFRDPLYNTGIHFISGHSGSGKTLAANIIIKKMNKKKDSFFYTNKDQFDYNNGERIKNNYDKQTKEFCLNKLFQNGKQIKRLPTAVNFGKYKKWCKGMVIDEVNASEGFNRRMNRGKEYNNIFVGLMEFFVTHRHQGIPRIYNLGQFYDFQDTQMQTAFKYHHEIFCKKAPRYFYYKKNGQIVIAPYKIKIITSVKTKEYDTKGQPLFIPAKKRKIKIDPTKHLESYNHLGFAEEYTKLPSLFEK